MSLEVMMLCEIRRRGRSGTEVLSLTMEKLEEIRKLDAHLKIRFEIPIATEWQNLHNPGCSPG